VAGTTSENAALPLAYPVNALAPRLTVSFLAARLAWLPTRLPVDSAGAISSRAQSKARSRLWIEPALTSSSNFASLASNSGLVQAAGAADRASKVNAAIAFCLACSTTSGRGSCWRKRPNLGS